MNQELSNIRQKLKKEYRISGVILLLLLLGVCVITPTDYPFVQAICEEPLRGWVLLNILATFALNLKEAQDFQAWKILTAPYSQRLNPEEAMKAIKQIKQKQSEYYLIGVLMVSNLLIIIKDGFVSMVSLNAVCLLVAQIITTLLFKSRKDYLIKKFQPNVD